MQAGIVKMMAQRWQYDQEPPRNDAGAEDAKMRPCSRSHILG